MKLTFLLKDFLGVVYSIAPLAIILVGLKLFVFRSSLESNRQFLAGIVFTIVGLFIFLQGAQMSLMPLAEATGAEMVKLHRGWIFVIAFVIGFTATLVEPALKTTVIEAENISVGAIPANLLQYLTAFGFACGMVIGIVKIIYGIKISWVLVPFLALTMILAYFSNETFAALAFDCASATTGPVNIPVNMMIALGLSRSLEGVDPLTAGFGLVGLTCLGAANAILAFGVIKA